MTHSGVFCLLVPASHGPTRDYGVEETAPEPLSFDRVNGGRQITSKTLLFRLPIELLQDVTSYLDGKDLESLALVDRDCRQLARSRQFASVVLDYSPETCNLLEALSREAITNQANNGTPPVASIGACIRRLTVATNLSEVSIHHDLNMAELETKSREAQDEEIGRFHEHYFETYLPLIDITLRHALPSLDELSWEDRIAIPTDMLTTIARTPIRHLKLRRIMLASDDEYPLPPREERRWALRSLDLQVQLDLHHICKDRSVSTFSTSILREAAPTLEKLTWKGCIEDRQSFGDGNMRFPRLRSLSLDLISMLDDSILEAFFPAEGCALRSVSISVGTDRVRSFLARRGQVRGLESLRMHMHSSRTPVDCDDPAFLSTNTQIKSLTLRMHTNENLDKHILPLLRSKFTRLTSLALGFGTPPVDESSLSSIAQISTLRSLWLTAGVQEGWCVNWAVDHDLTMACLSPLQNLRRLAFSRDTYASHDRVPPQEFYYEYAVVPHGSVLEDGDEDTREERVDNCWTGWHRERMAGVFEMYRAAFRALEWMYVGQYPMRVCDDGEVVFETVGRTQYAMGAVWEARGWGLE